MTMSEVGEGSASLDSEGRLIHKESGLEVSVVYFRIGYMPHNYDPPLSWEGREILERSQAIKCPSIDLQLVTVKKI